MGTLGPWTSTDPAFSHPSCAFVTYEKMESADQAVAEVGTCQTPPPSLLPPQALPPLLTEPSCSILIWSRGASTRLFGMPTLCPLSPFVPQLNGTQVESVQLKVNIARKQPMLDAATGKSVWGSLGKDGALPSSPPYSTPLWFPPQSAEYQDLRVGS